MKPIKMIASALLLLPLLAFYPAWGQKEPRGDVSVLIFDFTKLLEESKVGRDITGKVEDLEEDLQDEVNSAKEEFDAEAKRLEEQRNVLPPDTLRARAEELRLRQLSKQREIATRARAIQAGQQQAQRDILLTMRDVMDEIIIERNAHIVMERTAIFHYAGGLDVTDDLIRRLNRVLTSVDVTPIEQSN